MPMFRFSKSVLATALCTLLVCFVGCGTASSSSLPPSTPAPIATTPPLFRTDLDFTAMKAKNADTIAWIELPGTVIDYPVMHGVDNMKYLNTDVDGKKSLFGAIFVDMSNFDDFSSPVTVAYGHFTPDETYFTQLHNYKDPTYFAENREVFIYTPDNQMRYEIVAAFTIGDENILYEKDYADPKQMQGFIDWMASNNPKDDANLAMENVSTQDRFLMMSTCVQQVGGNNRYAVIARLVETR